MGPNYPRTQSPHPNPFPPNEVIEKKTSSTQIEESPLADEIPKMSLADAFAAPIGEVKNVDGASDSSSNKGNKLI